jgi:hypothetical protein
MVDGTIHIENSQDNVQKIFCQKKVLDVLKLGEFDVYRRNSAENSFPGVHNNVNNKVSCNKGTLVEAE